MDSLEEIDDTLWMILDPVKNNIDLKVLVEKYNYLNHLFISRPKKASGFSLASQRR